MGRQVLLARKATLVLMVSMEQQETAHTTLLSLTVSPVQRLTGCCLSKDRMVLTEQQVRKDPRVNRAPMVRLDHKVPQVPTVQQDPRAQPV